VAYHNARLLHERGHQVTVFTASTPRDQELGFPFKVEHLPAVFRVGNAPLTPSLLSKLQGSDLIHLHYPYIFGAELTALAAKRFNIPLLLTYHNRLEETHFIKRVLFKGYNLTAEPLVFRAASKLLAVRREHLTSLYAHLDRDSRLDELPNGVDTKLFKPQPKEVVRQQHGISAKVPLALFVGALDQAHRFKNVDGLIRAFAKAALSEARLWVVGDGDLKPQLQALAAQFGLEQRVQFLGRFAPQQLPALYSAADVLVLPSTGVESFGLVLLEAMACGTPVIASALPGVRTLVCEGQDGWLVAPGDEAALAQALATALSDPIRNQAMGHKGRVKVVQHYDWSVIGERLEEVYQEIVGG
jgi:glycosyltransferase involved in cell wall biosynthesis